MKRLLLTTIFVFTVTTAHAGGKWTGPTSPIDPMWGLKGSSIMSEALRSPDPCVVIPNTRPSQGELQDAYNRGKVEGVGTQHDPMALIEVLEWLKAQPRKDR